MHIRELQVDGYGPLHDLRLTLEAPVTVVFGSNEAGKSSLLRFIRSMLYGIPNRKDLVERGEPVYGGRHGGRLAVVSGGREFHLERYADGSGSARKAGGGLIVRDNNGTELRWTQPEWERHALGGVSDPLFRQLFAVSLDELHELLTLQGEEIGNFLYHAGLAGGASLSDARRKLASEMDKLYRPRGQTQEMNRLLASMKETEAAIRASRSGIQLFQEAKDSLLRTEKRLAELDVELPPLAKNEAGLRTALEQRELWLNRQLHLAEETELAERLPTPLTPRTPPLPEEAASAWNRLKLHRQAAADKVDKAAHLVRERLDALTRIRWDEQLLERSAELEKLEAMREAASARQEESETVTAELQMVDETIAQLLPRIAAEWDETDLAAFGSAAPDREPLRKLQQAWAETERTMERLESDAGRIERQKAALYADSSAAADIGQVSRESERHSADTTGSFGNFRAQTRQALLPVWNALEDDLRRFERATAIVSVSPGEVSRTPSDGPRTGHERKANRSTAGRVTAGLLAVSAVLMLLAGILTRTDGAVAFPYIAGAAVLAAVAAWAGWAAMNDRRRSDAPVHADAMTVGAWNENRRRFEERLSELLADPGKAGAALLPPDASIRQPVDEAAWKLLRQAVQDALVRFERRDRETDRELELNRRISELERERTALDADIQAAAGRLEALHQDWQRWLHRRQLPLSLHPDSLPELLSLIDQAQTALRRRAKIRERLAALEQIQSAFRQAAAALFENCPPPTSMEADAALSVAWLYRRAAEHRALKEEAQRSQRQLQEAEGELADAQAVLKSAEHDISAALREAGVQDEIGYEQRLGIDDRRRVLMRERREIELRLEAGRSPESLAALYRILDSHAEAALAESLRAAEDARQSAEDERTGLLDQRGRLAQELERLQREAESEDCRIKLSEMESKLEQLTERYAVLALCDRLLRDTKSVFEEERQPEVLQLASQYFREMTDGAYTRITAPADSTAPVIVAETKDRRMIDSVFLSRGTQEQLYLAMRFALAEAASRDVPLPLLLDDLFVHFDERRLRQTVPVLADIARTRQVILFTCHRHVAEAIGQGLPAAGIITWEAQPGASRFAVAGRGSSETASPS